MLGEDSEGEDNNTASRRKETEDKVLKTEDKEERSRKSKTRLCASLSDSFLLIPSVFYALSSALVFFFFFFCFFLLLLLLLLLLLIFLILFCFCVFFSFPASLFYFFCFFYLMSSFLFCFSPSSSSPWKRIGGTRGAPPFLEQKEERAQRQMNKRGALNLQTRQEPESCGCQRHVTRSGCEWRSQSKVPSLRWQQEPAKFFRCCDNKNLLVRMPVTQTTAILKVTQERLHQSC